MMKEASMSHEVDQAATEEVVYEDNKKLNIIAQDDETSSKASTQESAAATEEGEGEGESTDEEEKELYKERDDELCRFYRPLHKAALKGDWGSAEKFLTDHEEIVDITQGVNRMGMSILHVAANMGHSLFMLKLLRSRFFRNKESKLKEALTKKDNRDLTPLHYAASVGNMNAIKHLVSLDHSLTQIGGHEDDDIPLILAADNKASRRVLWYLAKQTADSRDSPPFRTADHQDSSPFSGVDGADLITSLVAVGHYDICLYLFNRYPTLASDSVSHWSKNVNYDLLGCLVCRPSEFPRRSKLTFWEGCIYELIPMGDSNLQQTKMAKVTQWILRAASNSLSYIVPGFEHIRNKKYQHKCIIELLDIACQKMSEWNVNEILKYFKKTEVHYDAAEHGGTEIIRAFIEYFPDIMDDAYVEGQILIRAIQNRQENVYNIMMERGITAKFLPGCEDEETEGNILHTTAKLAPYVRLSSVSCPALQMQRELQWFKAVEKFVPPSMKILENKDKQTPRELFTEQHKDLVKDAEKWMKETSNSCLVVATLIITVVFAAAFTIPGGLRNDEPGVPLFLRRRSFILFVSSDAVGMFSSATSIFMFLSILTARYSEDDFLYALPKRLILGLVSLLIAIASMMIAFGATLFLVIDPKSDLIIYPIIALSSIPVFLFIMLQLPLIIFMVRSTYGPSILKEKIMSKH